MEPKTIDEWVDKNYGKYLTAYAEAHALLAFVRGKFEEDTLYSTDSNYPNDKTQFVWRDVVTAVFDELEGKSREG